MSSLYDTFVSPSSTSDPKPRNVDDSALAANAAVADTTVTDLTVAENIVTDLTAAAVGNTCAPVLLHQILQDQTLIIDRERWFRLIQDLGEEMTSAEEAIYFVAGKPKKKTRRITYGNRFFADLYTLSSMVYELMNNNRESKFPNLPKTSSKTGCIHLIGQWIAEKRIRYERGDIHSIGRDVGFMDLIQSPTFAQCDQYYVLTQSEMLEFLFKRYGVKGEEKVATVDDKIRVAGIIFREEMRPFLPDMIGITRGSKVRAVLDAASGRKQFGLNRLYEQFIDPEVEIDLPTNWNTAENQQSVDEINGEGAFEQFGSFSANNLARIVLPWSQADINAIFGKVATEYNNAMEKYMKGTGGGSGSHALFGVWDEARSEQHKRWKERPVGWIAQYAGQMSMLYLGVVLMWDAQYGYPFCARKDPMPDECMIDDRDDTVNNQFITPRRLSSLSDSSTGKRSSRKSDVSDMVSEICKGRKEMLDLVKDIQKNGASNTVSDGGTSVLVKNISDTLGVISGCKKELKSLNKKKRKYASGTSATKTDKIKAVGKEIKKQRGLIATLEQALSRQQKQLQELTAAGSDSDDDNDSGDDDDSGDDNDDETDDGEISDHNDE